MHYKKIISWNTIIEFHNNWLGQETVIVNGQVLSKKSSVMGTDHYFTVLENGNETAYISTTRVDNSMEVKIDLRRNGELIQEGIPVNYGSKPKQPASIEKKQGLAKLQVYDLKEALAHLELALKFDPKDAEIYFHIACAYSVLERTREGFEALKQAVAHNLQDQEMILNHDMLAFLRRHHAFEGFLNSGFTDYDEQLIVEEEQADE